MEDDTPLHRKLIAYTKYLAEEVFPTEENALLHLEVFVDKDNNIIFGELACRLGGCFVNEELGAAFGLDPRMTWLKASLCEIYPQDLSQKTTRFTGWPIKCAACTGHAPLYCGKMSIAFCG